jgi:hypothetical protein
MKGFFSTGDVVGGHIVHYGCNSAHIAEHGSTPFGHVPDGLCVAQCVARPKICHCYRQTGHRQYEDVAQHVRDQSWSETRVSTAGTTARKLHGKKTIGQQALRVLMR